MWKLKGYSVDAFDTSVVVYNIWANTKNDLPSTMTDIGYGTALGFGSTAQTFDDSKEWRWNGTQWVEQTNGQEIEISADDIVYDNTSSGMTATNVQDAIDEIHTTDETQDNTISELSEENENQQLEINYSINTGAKNMFNINTTAVQNHITSTLTDDTLTVTSNGNWAHYSVPINLPAGDYILTTTISNFSKDSNAGATSVRIRIATSTSGGTSVVLETITGNGPITIPFTSPGGQFYVQFYPNYSSTTTFVSTFTANNVMIRDAVIKSTTYEPYAPTNRELYETSKPSYDFIFGLGTALNSNDDLNNYNKVGKIYAATGAIAATISNTPWTLSGFMVITIPMLTTSTFVQFLLPNTSGGKWYKRRYTTGAWSTWTEYDGTQVSSTQSLNSPLTLNLGRNDLNESLDSNFDLIDSIPEEEEGEEDDI